MEEYFVASARKRQNQEASLIQRNPILSTKCRNGCRFSFQQNRMGHDQLFDNWDKLIEKEESGELQLV